jgi:hypothetical protein
VNLIIIVLLVTVWTCLATFALAKSGDDFNGNDLKSPPWRMVLLVLICEPLTWLLALSFLAVKSIWLIRPSEPSQLPYPHESDEEHPVTNNNHGKTSLLWHAKSH